MNTQQQRREMERFAINLPALVSMNEKNREQKPMGLLTKDISARGAFFSCNQPLAVDSRVMVSFFIPGADSMDMAGAQVKVSGTVVRADYMGMAVRFDKAYHMSPMRVGSA